MTRLVSAIVALPLALASPVLAQSPRVGTIRGTVIDTTDGTGVRTVSVRLQSTGHIVLTDDQGRFEIADVPAGNQELYISAVDFILVKRAVVVVAGNDYRGHYRAD